MKFESILKIVLFICTILSIETVLISGYNNHILRENQELIQTNQNRISNIEDFLNVPKGIER